MTPPSKSADSWFGWLQERRLQAYAPTGPRVVEWFAGLGGLSAAWPEARLQVAVDINQLAGQVHQQNFGQAFMRREIESIPATEICDWPVDLWWLSPPCQPFSRKGKRRDISDPRARALLHLLACLPKCQPQTLGMENVPGFQGSDVWQTMMDTLSDLGYYTRSRIVCPTQLGWPNRRSRYYLLASRTPLPPWQPFPQWHQTLAGLLQSKVAPALWLNPALVQRIGSAMDRVDANQAGAVTACFGSSYGKQWLHSGSVLIDGDRHRRFSPREVARLLGFYDAFSLEGLTPRQAWSLLGNSLSLPVVRYVLAHVPGGPQHSPEVL